MDLNLKRLIRSVQEELEDAQRERESSGQRPLFKVEELTVELTFAIAEETSAKGGFSLKIIEIGGSEKVAENETHKLTLRFSALHGDTSYDDERAETIDQPQDGARKSAKPERDSRIQEALGLYPSRNQARRRNDMTNDIDSEQFLLRNQVSEALGYYSPFYNSVLIPKPIFEGQDEQLLSTLFHEKTHWAQFNLSPWGQFLLYLYECYVGASEEILVHTKAIHGRIDKPLWIFMASGSRREHDERLNALCNNHITTLDALPLLFRGGNAISTQALDDAIKTLHFFAITPERRQELMESEAFPLTVSSLPADWLGVPSWRSLVETWARTVELLAGVRDGFSPHDRKEVLLEKIMQGDYGALFPIFLELSGLNALRINEIQTYSMLAVCAIAMQSPVHAGFADHWSGLSDWSDVHPETRFMKAARAVQATGPVGDLLPDDYRQHEAAVADLMDQICAHLGWPRAGELAEGFAQRCSNGVVTPGLYAPGYLTAAPMISRDPSLLAFGPCHSDWNEFETRIGSVPVFVDPLLSKRVPGPAGLDNLELGTHAQILTGVKFNLFNEILYEDSFSKFEIDAFTDGDWVEDQAARSVADRLFIIPVLDALECRDVHVKDIFQWDVYTRGPEGNKKLILAKSAMHRDFNEVFDRDPVPWQLAVNGQRRE